MNKKKVALLTSIVIVFVVSFVIGILQGSDTKNVLADGDHIVYAFANDKAGSAAGSISVTTDSAGEYNLYWGDGEGQKLSYEDVEFSELGTVTTTEDNLTASYDVISDYTVIPDGAKEVLATNSEGSVTYHYDIPENKWFSEGKEQYKLALMSDVHFERYAEYNEDDSVPAFSNALSFINEQGIDTLFLTGDLSNQGEIESYNKFNNAISKYPNMTVYTCMGNHDVSWTKNAEKQVKLFAENINKTRTTDPNILEVCDNGVDFVYKKGEDIYIFLSQTKAFYGKNRPLLANEQLNWLHKTLNRYADKKVYLFFHTYLTAEGGEEKTAVGNLVTPLGYYYELSYPYGNSDEQRLRSLLKKYANVTMFSGHSHWAYEEQIYNSNLNIGNISPDKSGASLVHLASVSAPRTAVLDQELFDGGLVRYENSGEKSEGTIAIRYKDSTVYIGVDFVNGKYITAATYVDYDGAKSTPEAAITTGKTKITKIGKIKKIKKSSKKNPKYQVTIKYKKVSPVYKYHILYSTSKKFSTSKTKNKYTTKTKYTITKLKPGKTYYIKVQAYRYQFGYKIYGTCEKVRKIKTPKKK